MMKTLLVVVLLVGAACAQPEPESDSWQEFKQKYGKVYKDPTEESHRRKVFAANQALIAQHMREYAAGKRTFTVAHNKFSDLTQEEFNSQYKGIRWDEDTAPPAPPESYETSASQGVPQESRPRRSASDADMPAALDYRQHGLVTDVKDQGNCGSCYVYGAVAAVEAARAKSGWGLLDISHVQAIDCSINRRCFGGWHFAVLAYVRERGLEAEEYYKFLKETRNSCPTNHSPVTTHISAFGGVTPPGDELELQRALVTHGPVAVTMTTKHVEFKHYKSGVYIQPECETYYTDHVMLVIGYGTERLANGTEVDYWLLKNSWSADWGDAGYVKTLRNGGNMCGVATWAFYPLTGETEYDFYGYGETAKVGDALWEILRNGNVSALKSIAHPAN